MTKDAEQSERTKSEGLHSGTRRYGKAGTISITHHTIWNHLLYQGKSSRAKAASRVSGVPRDRQVHPTSIIPLTTRMGIREDISLAFPFYASGVTRLLLLEAFFAVKFFLPTCCVSSTPSSSSIHVCPALS